MATKSAQEMFDDAFAPGGARRTPRSDAYKSGVMMTLRCIIEAVCVECPYEAGTAEFDAFWAGAWEGRQIFWREQEEDA